MLQGSRLGINSSFSIIQGLDSPQEGQRQIRDLVATTVVFDLAHFSQKIEGLLAQDR